MTLSKVEEDRMAEVLSNLSPLDYEALMRKVKRSQWQVIPNPFKLPKRK